ncbi:MAG: DUF4827 domain-containing protein [Pseudoflavonifractor sp.]|nr:DUF4827 domain-containing protein [Alloprevotella sp.]MCM1116385.1 DUF4827 domain-containing protein [Pseudoflavonifractor sp.]
MNNSFYIFLSAAMALFLAACNDDASYTDLLNTESKHVNNFLADHRVIGSIPADSVFESGPDAPYYMLDDEGKIFMQVLDPGYGPKAYENQLVYFRYTRYNLTTYRTGQEMEIYDSNENTGYQATYFRFGDSQLPSSTEWGSGIQMPMRFLPLNCRVNLVVKAEYGLTNESSYVQPMLFNIRYYPSKL